MPVSSDHLLNPSADITVNGWTTHAGQATDLWAMVDEAAADDADFIQSAEGPKNTQVYETQLESPAEVPTDRNGHVLRYRYRKPAVSDRIDLLAGIVGFGNLVPINAGGIETDTSSWQVVTECTLARVTSPVRTGTGALSMTKSATATTYMSARMIPYSLIPVTPGVEYTATIYFRAATVARNCTVWMDWADSAGTHISGPNAAALNTTTGWTAVTVTGVAPANAAYIRPVPQINQVPLNEVHYVDDVSVVGPGGLIASWQHNDIGTSWVTADQALTLAQAESISDYTDLRIRLTPSAVGAAAYTQRQSPDALVSTSGVTAGATVTAIQDDPDAPNTSWITASSVTASGWVHVSFPTPGGPLQTGAGNTQRFAVLVRKQGGTGTPTIITDIYEAGVLKASGPSQNVTSTTGQVLAIVWEAGAYITDPTQVEMRVRFTPSGGSPSVRASVDIGAMEWDAAIQPVATGRAQVSWMQLELPAGVVTHRPTAAGTSSSAGTAAAVRSLRAGATATRASTGTAAAVRPQLPVSASGVRTSAGSAAAVRIVRLTASAARVSTGTAAAVRRLPATASAARVSVGSGAAVIQRRAQASGARTSVGSASAVRTLRGVASGTVRQTAGASAGLITLRPVAGGASSSAGTAAATVATHLAAAAGARSSAGTAAASFRRAATATATRQSAGTALARQSHSVAAAGTRTSSGTAAGLVLRLAEADATRTTAGTATAARQLSARAVAARQGAGSASALIQGAIGAHAAVQSSGTVTATLYLVARAAGLGAPAGSAAAVVVAAAVHDTAAHAARSSSGTAAVEGIGAVVLDATASGSRTSTGTAGAVRRLTAAAAATRVSAGTAAAVRRLVIATAGSSWTAGTARAVEVKYAAAHGVVATTGTARPVVLVTAAGQGATSGTAAAVAARQAAARGAGATGGQAAAVRQLRATTAGVVASVGVAALFRQLEAFANGTSSSGGTAGAGAGRRPVHEGGGTTGPKPGRPPTVRQRGRPGVRSRVQRADARTPGRPPTVENQGPAEVR